MASDDSPIRDGGTAVVSGGERPTLDRPELGEDLLVGVDSETTPVLSVVLPTMNEEAGIGECLERIERAITDLGVTTEIIVSDSSTDRTPEIAREFGAIVVEPDRPGYGYAYRYAFEHARGNFIVMGDADTTYDFTAIPRLLTHLIETDADMVLGSRLDGEIEPDAMPPLHRYVGNPLLTAFLNIFYDMDVSDAHSGFRVLTREALETMHLATDGMEFASEMIMEAGARDLTIEEVPIVYHEREGEETLESLTDGWRHVKFMLMNAPGYVFSIPATGCLLVGLLTMVLSVGDVVLGSITFGTHTMIAGSLLTIVGYQVGSLAVFSSIATDPIRKPEDPITDWIRENATLEHSASAGLALFTFGAVYLAFVAWRWFARGVIGFEFIVWNLLGLTAVVLGVQTIFYAFFMSMLAQQRTPDPT